MTDTEQQKFKRFAYPGESFQQTGGDCKEGMVEVSEERPSIFAKCKKVSEGKGVWVEPSWIEGKWLTLKNWWHTRFPCYKAKLRILQPILLSLVLVAIPGIIVYKTNNSEWGNYLMAIVTGFLVSCCFYLINVSYPRRKRAQFEALRIFTLLRRLVELKDTQYRILGFRSSEISHVLRKEDPMNVNKARVLVDLMESYNRDKCTRRETQCLREYSELPDTHKLSGHFDASHKLFLSIFEELKSVVKPELFPTFYRALMRMDEQLKYEKCHSSTNLFNTPREYEQYHFRLIEYIECLYEMECVPFVVFTPLTHFTVLEFDDRFRKLAAYPPSLNWY
ncbi:hypothetical protein [Vibrio splendidus]|uniref:hypothetical protein n=1 Tax=Vibrio splendidus TaxID=29497 RepID=UPI00080D90D9|nr:hypothetical protein [Vibrio splendidus]OCH67881.1 hypothetical protein A6D94_06665 [Vibrio splendidus]